MHQPDTAAMIGLSVVIPTVGTQRQISDERLATRRADMPEPIAGYEFETAEQPQRHRSGRRDGRGPRL